MKRFVAVAIFSLLCARGMSARAELILESATLGGSPPGVDLSVGALQYLAARFRVVQTTQIDHVGGFLYTIATGNPNLDGNQLLFAAIEPISGPNGFPSQAPATFTPLAVTTFSALSFGTDILVPLSATLAPGDYALILGSGRFGATGRGAMPTRNTDTSQASYFQGSFPSPSTTHWGAITEGGLRFVATGSVVPEPSTFILATLGGLAALLAIRRRR